MILTGNWSHTCTQSEAAKILNKPVPTIESWRVGGVGPLARRSGGGDLEYSLRDVYEYRDLIDADEASGFLGVAPETIRRRVPVAREMCGIRYYSTSDVWAYEEKLTAAR